MGSIPLKLMSPRKSNSPRGIERTRQGVFIAMATGGPRKSNSPRGIERPQHLHLQHVTLEVQGNLIPQGELKASGVSCCISSLPGSKEI